MDTKNMTVEQRLERIESLLDKLVTMAKQHPMGKTVLAILGL